MDMQYKTSETGMYLDDVFMLLADYEISRAQRYPSPVSLLHISLNLDQAKPAQSKSIKQHFAGILNSSLRISDIPATLRQRLSYSYACYRRERSTNRFQTFDLSVTRHE